MGVMIDTTERSGALDLLKAPVTVLVGHFGAGKTEIAINLAVAFKQRGEVVSLADLDLVKPYFRSRLARHELAALGVGVVVPEGEMVYADLPILLPQVKGLIARAGDGAGRLIIDAGGDDLGARVLGAIAGLTDPSHTEVLFVVNTRRPFAETLDEVATMLREVEVAARLKITGLVANTHLMEETTPAVVREGRRPGRAARRADRNPIAFLRRPRPACGLARAGRRACDLPDPAASSGASCRPSR